MTKNNEVYAVILAGGSGTRFWPKSRLKEPKQLCKIGSQEQTMIELTLDRLDGYIPASNRIIVTHQKQIEATKAIVKDKAAHFIAEPEAKNTGAALALGAFAIKDISNDKNPIMMSFHADHLIQDQKMFLSTLQQAERVAREGQLTLIGMKPAHPETGFGYIECGEMLETDAYKVKSFKEKPDFETATRYFKSGDFLWNSGLFVWSIHAFLDELREFLPNTLKELEAFNETLSKPLDESHCAALAPIYARLQNIAVDHAVLECSDKTTVVKGSFPWKDVGSWGALTECFATDQDENLLIGQGHFFDCKGTVIDSDGPYVAALGLQDMIVVSAKNAILVCPKSRSQDVKRIVEHLKENQMNSLI